MKVLPKPPSGSEMRQVVVESQLWKAIFRHGYPDDPPNRALVIMSNVFLHLHPVKVKKHAAKFTWTYGLGVAATAAVFWGRINPAWLVLAGGLAGLARLGISALP